MMLHTIGAICLGSSGNEQGGHYFLSLMTGRHLLHDQWTELPMPHDAIAHFGDLSHAQGMPKSLTFTDCFGFELADDADDVDDDHGSAVDPTDALDFDPADGSDDDSSDDDASSTADSDHGNDFGQPLPGLPAGVDDMDDNDNDSYEGMDNMDDNDNDNCDENDAHNDGDGDSYDENSTLSNGDEDSNNNDDGYIEIPGVHSNTNNIGGDAQLPDDNYYLHEFHDETADDDNNDAQIPQINIPDAMISSPPASPHENAGVWGETTEVGRCETNPGECNNMNQIMDL